MGQTRLVGERRSGGADIKRDGSNVKLTENYVFLVETELADETRFNVLGNADLPTVGITQTLYGAVCISKAAARSKENTHFWEITCVFETGNVKQEGSGPPNTWTPVFELSFESYDEPSYVDAKGKRYVNSAGDDFDDDLTVKRKLISIDFFQYESISLSEVAISNRNSTVNKTAFVGYPKHTLLLTLNKAARGYINRIAYWRIEYKMTYKKSTWDLNVLDKGPRHKLGSPAKLTQFFTQGTPDTPYIGLLNGAGKRLAARKDLEDAASETTYKFIKFDLHDELEFSSFIRRAT